jgi:hypothetical protein
MKRARKASLAAVVVVLALSVPVRVQAQAAFTPERPATPGSRIFANARVVAIDKKARTITVRGGGVGKDETFPVEAQALQRAGELKPGEQVMLTLRAGGTGPEVVTQIERSVAGAGARRGSAGGRAAPRRRDHAGAAAPPARPAPPAAAASPSPTPASSPEAPRLPTDVVGPLRDPRLEPNFDPRQNPLRDPRVVPGLSEPAPTPTPSPTPTPPPVD